MSVEPQNTNASDTWLGHQNYMVPPSTSHVHIFHTRLKKKDETPYDTTENNLIKSGVATGLHCHR